MEFISAILNRLRHLEADDVLGRVGLQKRRSRSSEVIPALGYLAAGLVVGAGLGLMFAPSSGRELRREIGTRATELKDRGMAAVKRQAPDNGIATGYEDHERV